MATAAVTYTFVDGTTASAPQANQNFSDLVNFLNGSVVHKDGSVAMTGNLTLPGNPASALQATPKQYSDPLQAAKLTSSYDIGTVLTNFYIPATWTMPTVTNNRGVRVEFYVPKVWSFFPSGQSEIRIQLQKTDGTVLQTVDWRIAGDGGYEGAMGNLLRYDMYDNSVFTAGATVALRLQGQTIAGTAGLRLEGQSTAPIFYTVTRI